MTSVPKSKPNRRPWLGWMLAWLMMLCASCARPKQTLNLLYFPDSFDPGIVKEFEQQFECKIVFDYFTDGTSTAMKLAAGGVSVYDVVGTGMDGFAAIPEGGLAAPLRHENLPNLKNIDPRFANLEFDPGNRYTVPYLRGMIGLFTRHPGLTEAEKSWGLIFDPSKQAGPFWLMDEQRTCLAAALRYKGYSVNTVDPEELAAARDLLLEAKRRARGFASPLGISQRVVSQEVTAAICWNESPVIEAKGDRALQFFVPREGSCLAMDSFFIPAKAPHRDLAEKFLNFLLEARVAVQNSAYTKSATPNRAAYDLLPAEIQNNPDVYPSPEIMNRLEFLKDVKEKSRLYDEIWTQVKSK